MASEGNTARVLLVKAIQMFLQSPDGKEVLADINTASFQRDEVEVLPIGNGNVGVFFRSISRGDVVMVISVK